MLTRLIISLLLWGLLSAGFLSSCSPARTPPGANTIGGSYEGALYSYHSWDEGLAILIWHDYSYGESGCRGTSSTEDPVYRLSCEAAAWNGRRFEWEINTRDGITGQISINEEPYSLAEGAVFLVSGTEGEPRIVQLQRNLAGLAPDSEAIIAWGGGDPEITAFLERAAVSEVPDEGLPDDDAARAALITFFDHLYAGNYAAAVDLYGGSYEIMVDHNPSVDPADLAALWRAACMTNGAQCLQVASAHLQEAPQVPEGEFVFAVEFVRDDGSIFSRGACCGENPAEVVEQRAFPMRVRKVAENYYQVLDLPVYLP